VRLLVGGNLLTGALREARGIGSGGQALGIVRACSDIQSSWAWLNDPVLSGLEGAPVVGADLQALRLAVRSAAGVCTPATPLVSGFNSKAPVASLRQLGASRLRYFGLETLKQLAIADSQIHGIDPSKLHFGLGPKFAAAQKTLSQVSRLEPQLKSMVSVGSAVLASPANSQWLIATQNLAEARGTGGILGSYAVVGVGNAGVHLVEAGSDQTLAAYGPVDFSSLPIDTALTWGVEPNLWQDLNPSMHAPYTAKQIYDSWLGFKHQRLAGVIFIGQGWAQNLVGAVGPITVDGVTLNGTSAAEFMAKGIYARYPAVAAKNNFVKQLMRSLAGRLAAGNFDFAGFAKTMQQNQTGDKLFSWSSNAGAQRTLVADSAAGYVDCRPGNKVWIGINNGGGNKIDAYVRASVDYRVVVSGQAAKSGKPHNTSDLWVTLTNGAPAAGLPAYVNGRLDLPVGAKYQPGSNIDLVSVYLPKGANLTGFLLDNQPYSVHDDLDRGREVLSFRIELNPGQSKRLWVGWNLWGAEVDSKPSVITNSTYVPVKVLEQLRIGNE
jgi:hypothetical protein